MYAFAQVVWAHRAEIFGFIVAMDQALSATGKVKANSVGELFVHSFIASVRAQKTPKPAEPDAEAPAVTA